MNYAGLMPYLVKALQEIASISGTFRDNLVAWLGDAGDGIDKLFAHEIVATNGSFSTLVASSTTADTGNFTTTNTQKLCLGSRA